jgi:fructose-bisphosphate aldolase, class I
VIRIADGLPSDGCVIANAHALARYAALCQEAGIVPIVEPETLMDGDHTIERAEQVTTQVLSAVFSELRTQRVRFSGMVLKPNMVLAGYDAEVQADVSEVAQRTLWTLRGTVPAAVPGVAFLSGGQRDSRAAEHLSAINQLGGAPWQLTFSFGRALVADALNVWAGSEHNRGDGQRTLEHRVHCNTAARGGRYFTALETDRALAETLAQRIASGDGSAAEPGAGITVPA